MCTTIRTLPAPDTTILNKCYVQINFHFEHSLRTAFHQHQIRDQFSHIFRPKFVYFSTMPQQCCIKTTLYLTIPILRASIKVLAGTKYLANTLLWKGLVYNKNQCKGTIHILQIHNVQIYYPLQKKSKLPHTDIWFVKYVPWNRGTDRIAGVLFFLACITIPIMEILYVSHWFIPLCTGNETGKLGL